MNDLIWIGNVLLTREVVFIFIAGFLIALMVALFALVED